MSAPDPPPGTAPDLGHGFPTRIGDRYELLTLLGQGGFGRVYLGLDPILDRQVAIKVVAADRWSAEARERFLREARAAANIHHRNVCPVYDAGNDPVTGLYVVSRYVSGGSLADRLARTGAPLPPRDAVAIARGIARGLAAAHEHGVIHRNLTPANVLYDAANREVLVTDFGLVRVSDTSGRTMDGAFLGHPAYMSPEQAHGEADQVGPLSDVYALGVILYRMLTGRGPFTAHSAIALMMAHVVETPHPPSVAHPGLDPRLDALCLRALEKRPADRYGSAKAFAGALDAYLQAGERSAASPTESGTYLPAPPRYSAPPAAAPPASPPPPPPARPPVGYGDDFIRFSCPRCSKLLKARRADAGRMAHCSCGARLTVPYSPEADSPPPSPSISATEIPRPGAAPSAWPSRPARRTAPAESPPPITDKVHFSVTAPAAMRAGQRYALNVWAHLAAQLAEVIVRAERAGGPVRVHTKSGVRVARGTRLTVQLRIPAFPPAAPDDTDVLEWDGEIGNATFPVHVPPGTAPGSYDGTVLVFAEGFQIAKLHFDVQVAGADAPVGPLAAREVRHKRAFASYASQDRDAVLARIQGIQKVAPDLDVFLDVAALRSGEKYADRLERELANRDVFYLFWSASASASKWVEREWRAALQARGLDYIDPVPLVDPNTVPPPPELASALHFNDWVLAYMRGAGAGAAAAARRPFRWLALAVLFILVVAGTAAALMHFVLSRSDK